MNSDSPLCKGGWGRFLGAAVIKSPQIALYQRGTQAGSLFTDKPLVFGFDRV